MTLRARTSLCVMNFSQLYRKKDVVGEQSLNILATNGRDLTSDRQGCMVDLCYSSIGCAFTSRDTVLTCGTSLDSCLTTLRPLDTSGGRRMNGHD
jgi:hypothetical protein